MSFELDPAERLAAVKAHITLDGSDDGQYSIATSRKPPWHQFGPVFAQDMTVDQALAASHTDWDVTVQDLTTQWITEEGVTTITAPDRNARIAPNPYTGEPVYLGTVGSALPVIQNREVAEWGYDILGAARGDSDKGMITSIGSFGQQRKFFTTLTLPDTIMVGGKDPVGLYLTLLEHHDGMGALTAVLSPTRAECRNTTTIAINKAKARVSLRHTTGIKDRMTQVRNLLGVTEDYMAAFEKMSTEMWDRSFTDIQFFDLVQDLKGDRPDPEKGSQTSVTQWDNTFEALLAQRTDPANAGSQPGSGWNAFQAVVSYDNYGKRAKGTTVGRQESRAGGVLLGANDRVEQKAMAFILAAR